jgi:hypothetical protein
MWERLTNDAWRSGVFLKGNLQAVELLFDAWAEIQIHYGDKWRTNLGRCQTATPPWIAARIRAVLASLHVVG